jgi:hypothetical protein
MVRLGNRRLKRDTSACSVCSDTERPCVFVPSVPRMRGRDHGGRAEAVPAVPHRMHHGGDGLRMNRAREFGRAQYCSVSGMILELATPLLAD